MVGTQNLDAEIKMLMQIRININIKITIKMQMQMQIKIHIKVTITINIKIKITTKGGTIIRGLRVLGTMWQYLSERTVYVDANGMYRALWQGGFGMCREGVDPYLQNCLEGRWNAVKTLLPRGFVYADCSEMTCEIAAQFKSWFERRRFNMFRAGSVMMVPCLLHRQQAGKSERLTEGPDAGKQVGRLSLSVILEYFQKEGAAKTFLHRRVDGNIEIAGNIYSYDEIWVVPKFCLAKAFEKPAEMKAMMRLATASSYGDICNALGGAYSWSRHKYLREHFTALYKVGTRVYDSHHDWVRFFGHTEWCYFIRTLPSINTFNAAPPAHGPARPEAPVACERTRPDKLATPKRRLRHTRHSVISSSSSEDAGDVEDHPPVNAHGSGHPSVAAHESDGENGTPWSLLIGFSILDLQYPSPSQILGTFSRFSKDFLGK